MTFVMLLCLQTQGKHKRGDHGSSPEVVPNLAKKPNMTAGDREEVFEDCSEKENQLCWSFKKMLTTIQENAKTR